MRTLLTFSVVLNLGLGSFAYQLVKAQDRAYWEGSVTTGAFYQAALNHCTVQNGTAVLHVQELLGEISKLRVACYDSQSAPDKEFHRQLAELVKHSPNGTICMQLPH